MDYPTQQLITFIMEHPGIATNSVTIGVVVWAVRYHLAKLRHLDSTLTELSATLVNLQHVLFGVQGDNGLMSSTRELREKIGKTREIVSSNTTRIQRVEDKINIS